MFPIMIEVRKAREKDLDDVITLENKVWPPGTRSPREKFESRLRIFPEGFFLAYKEGSLIGVSTSQIIKYDGSTIDSWEKITDFGWIRTHNPMGNALYVVSLGAISRSGGGSALINAQKKLATELGLDFDSSKRSLTKIGTILSFNPSATGKEKPHEAQSDRRRSRGARWPRLRRARFG